MFQRAFSVSTREPAALLFAPGGHSPTGVFVAWCNVGTFVRLCFGVSCGIARVRSFVCNRGRACRGHVVPVVSVRHVVAVAVASLGVAMAVASVASWARPCRGCGVVICAAVARLRHADEC